MALYWTAHLAIAWQACVVPKAPFENIARGRPARQSSLSAWSKGGDDATGGVSGRLTGSFQFHTAAEQRAWWEVDLTEISAIRQIVLYNCLDAARKRPLALRIDGWLPGTGYGTLLHTPTAVDFGGIDGFPFVWLASQPIFASRLRVTLLQPGCLHLDQIEIYGHRADSRVDS